VVLFDDFVGGEPYGTGVIGTMGWNSISVGTGSSINTSNTVVSNSFGATVLVSGTTSGTGYAGIYLIGACATYLGLDWAPVVFDMRWRVLLSNAASTTFMGISNTASGDAVSTDEIGISFINGTDTYWSLVTKSASGARNAVAIGTSAPDTNWHTFRIRGDGTGAIYASIDGGTEVSTSTSVPTNVNVTIVANNTSTGTTRTTAVDYFWLSLTLAR
jgi:hypothetical protein